eukprot:8676600-Pyramimonas_sp.AAC.1
MVVLAGFPANPPNNNIEEFLMTELTKEEGWKYLQAFAPNVRSTAAMVRAPSELAVLDFVAFRKSKDITFNSGAIRAKVDKPPEQRRSTSMAFSMAAHFQSSFARQC